MQLLQHLENGGKEEQVKTLGELGHERLDDQESTIEDAKEMKTMENK